MLELFSHTFHMPFTCLLLVVFSRLISVLIFKLFYNRGGCNRSPLPPIIRTPRLEKTWFLSACYNSRPFFNPILIIPAENNITCSGNNCCLMPAQEVYITQIAFISQKYKTLKFIATRWSPFETSHVCAPVVTHYFQGERVLLLIMGVTCFRQRDPHLK